MRAQLILSDLSRAQLMGVYARWAQLTGADLSEAHLEEAELMQAQLTGADLNRARMTGVRAWSAQLTGAHHYGAQMTGANLSGARLENVLANGVQLTGANLSGAQLEGANLAKATLHHTDLRQASLDKKTALSGTMLTDARLDGVIFDNTDLSVVNWEQVPRLQDERVAQHARYGIEEPDDTKQGKRKPRTARKDEYQAAVRAYRRLAVALQANGMNEEAAGYAYRAQVMQRHVLRYSGWHAVGRYLFSWFLDGLAGYGYAPGRTVLWYLTLAFGFACAYWLLGPSQGYRFSFDGALVFSVTSFHGRGFFPGGLSLEDAITKIAALEAVVGLLIEISFIATFTQRFFGQK